MKRLKILLIAALAISAAALISIIVAYKLNAGTIEVRDHLEPPPYGMWIKAEETGEPANYEVWENPDKWTRTALENPDKWVHVDNQGECWVWKYKVYHVQYKGQFYYIRLVFVD